MSCHTDRNIGRRPSDKHFKHMYLLQRLELFLHLFIVGRIKINGYPAQKNDIKRSFLIEIHILHSMLSSHGLRAFMCLCVLFLS